MEGQVVYYSSPLNRFIDPRRLISTSSSKALINPMKYTQQSKKQYQEKQNYNKQRQERQQRERQQQLKIRKNQRLKSAGIVGRGERAYQTLNNDPKDREIVTNQPSNKKTEYNGKITIPGPGHYNPVKMPKNQAPQFRFGTSQRDPYEGLLTRAGPGPGQYNKVKKGKFIEISAQGGVINPEHLPGNLNNEKVLKNFILKLNTPGPADYEKPIINNFYKKPPTVKIGTAKRFDETIETPIKRKMSLEEDYDQDVFQLQGDIKMGGPKFSFAFPQYEKQQKYNKYHIFKDTTKQKKDYLDTRGLVDPITREHVRTPGPPAFFTTNKTLEQLRSEKQTFGLNYDEEKQLQHLQFMEIQKQKDKEIKKLTQDLPKEQKKSFIPDYSTVPIKNPGLEWGGPSIGIARSGSPEKIDPRFLDTRGDLDPIKKEKVLTPAPGVYTPNNDQDMWVAPSYLMARPQSASPEGKTDGKVEHEINKDYLDTRGFVDFVKKEKVNVPGAGQYNLPEKDLWNGPSIQLVRPSSPDRIPKASGEDEEDGLKLQDYLDTRGYPSPALQEKLLVPGIPPVKEVSKQEREQMMNDPLWKRNLTSQEIDQFEYMQNQERQQKGLKPKFRKFKDAIIVI